MPEYQAPVPAEPVETSPSTEEAPQKHIFLKILLAIGGVILALVLGYIFVYWWVFNDLSSIFSMSALKGQVVSNQEAAAVQDQLEALGFKVDKNELFQLDSPSSTNYKASVISGYQPEKIEEKNEDIENAYYFYDENGNPYFLISLKAKSSALLIISFIH